MRLKLVLRLWRFLKNFSLNNKTLKNEIETPDQLGLDATGQRALNNKTLKNEIETQRNLG